jgi:hypothetical protein
MSPRQLLLGLLVLIPVAASSQAPAPATVREYQAEFTTYPYSDPNPIPVIGRIYPYFRFDGFTDVPVKRMWKVIDLENRWIRVSILPEIGGKIWRAIDKATGKSFIYDNHVVKFRDIAMRGPWTSGGIEANYGIIGHTPNVATPVDYITERRPDGSVTCTIGALDLLTRTSWRLAISLPADKAYFTTSSFWHNGTPFEQPYYSGMNAAIPASEDTTSSAMPAKSATGRSTAPMAGRSRSIATTISAATSRITSSGHTPISLAPTGTTRTSGWSAMPRTTINRGRNSGSGVSRGRE